jgi:methylase of polypeptide subunit release factors
MKIGLKHLAGKVAERLGYEISRIRVFEFTLGGITYKADACSSGKLPESELAAQAVIRLIRQREMRGLSVLDMACGLGVIGLTVFSMLSQDDTVKSVTLCDINIYNLYSLARTLRMNNLAGHVGSRIRYYLSDVFSGIPEGEGYDLIVVNPPHFYGEEDQDQFVSARQLNTFDRGWSFHRSFYEQCHRHLKKEGEAWLLENSHSTSPNDFMVFIQANRQLKYLGHVPEEYDKKYYWMMIKRWQ